MGYNKNSKSDSTLFESKDVTKGTDVTAVDKNDKKPYKCEFAGCNLAFRKLYRLRRHINVHTGERNYKCSYPECDKAYTNNSHLRRHVETHKVIKKLYKCSECPSHLSNPQNLKRHYKRIHMDRDKLTCKECSQTFLKKYQFRKHMTMHNPVIHKCDQCNKIFINLTKLRRHKKTHEERSKRYSCKIPGCKERFGYWLHLCTHIKTQHRNDYICKKCGKIFLCKYDLRLHSQVHKKDRSVIPCPFDKCPRVYYYKNNLTNHIRIHHFGEKFECDICKIQIVTKQRLKEHIQKLHVLETRIKRTKKLQRKKRKDAGINKKSTTSKLVGVDLPIEINKMVLRRKKNIAYIEQFKLLSTDNPDVIE